MRTTLWFQGDSALKTDYLASVRSGDELNIREQISLVMHLSLPTIMAHLSTTAMEYIDAAMVGSLGAAASASIGLVASSTWLFNGICFSSTAGYTVMAAQQIGAGGEKEARNLMKEAFLFGTALAMLVGLIGALVSSSLPRWLGADEAICRDAGRYFLVFALALPVSRVNNIAAAMLESSGNMRTPSLLNVLMCFMDVLFNALLIYPTRVWHGITLPGAGLGVLGAALGTALSHLVTALLMLYALLVRSPMLHLRKGEPLRFTRTHFRQNLRLALPVAAQEMVLSGAQVVSTRIVAPLGTVAIAANSFAVTAEGLCYMPGYGIGNAAAVIIGQSTGAGRKELTRKLGWIITLIGMGIMALTGAAMYFAAPFVIGMLSPDPAVVALGTEVLRLEVVAEPLYAASIVGEGVCRGAGDTLAPSLLEFGSMWLIRLPIALLLSRTMGLRGVWIGMTVELCARGLLFLLRLAGKKWQKEAVRID